MAFGHRAQLQNCAVSVWRRAAGGGWLIFWPAFQKLIFWAAIQKLIFWLAGDFGGRTNERRTDGQLVSKGSDAHVMHRAGSVRRS